MSGGKSLKLALLILIAGVCSIAGYSQAKPDTGVDDIYLAKDDGTGKAGESATVFRTTDIPIYCIVQLATTAKATVTMNLVAENVAGVKADTKVVSTSYTTKEGENRVNFFGKPVGKWTPGKYRADIFVDGKPYKNLSFEIKDPSNVTAARSFQPPKPISSVSPQTRRSPYVQSTARVINP
jgi:hypothetical protein